MRKMFVLFAAVSLGAAALAQGTGKDKSWFQNTLNGLKSSISKKYQSTSVRTSAVAAVRGADADAQADKPYWKGGAADKAAKKEDAERKEFAAAIELILDGKSAEGEAALKAFVKKHPKSKFVPDVKEALSRLSGDKPEAPKPAPAKAAEAPAPAEAPAK